MAAKISKDLLVMRGSNPGISLSTPADILMHHDEVINM